MEPPELSYAMVQRVAVLLSRGWSRDEVFLRLIARGYDPIAVSEFMEYVVKARSSLDRSQRVARRV